MVPNPVQNKINGINVDELRRQGLLQPKGTENIRRMRYLGRVGRVFSIATVVVQVGMAAQAQACAEIYGTTVWYQMMVQMGAVPQVEMY